MTESHKAQPLSAAVNPHEYSLVDQEAAGLADERIRLHAQALLELQEFKRALEVSPAREMFSAETAISLESNPAALLLETTA